MELLGREYRVVGTLLQVSEPDTTQDFGMSNWRTVTDKERGGIGYPERAVIDAYYIQELRTKLEAFAA